MLFKNATLEAIADGRVTVVFRCWKRPTVKTGGTLVTRIGLLAIDRVDQISLGDISMKHALAAGFQDLGELKDQLTACPEGMLYRINFHLQGPDPRIELRSKTGLSKEEFSKVKEQLVRWDRASPNGPWTKSYLELIGKNPGVLTPDLARVVGVEKVKFKTNVRKLKSIGLTVSLRIGYRLSPRGEVVLERLR